MATIPIVGDDALLLSPHRPAQATRLQRLHRQQRGAGHGNLFATQAVDGIILTWPPPGADGMELLTWALARTSPAPSVLILTACDGVEDRVN